MISLIGIAGLGYYNVLSGVIRGLGDSITPLVFLIIGTVLNIGLDIWFVAGFQMEVAGVALATVISQVLTSIMCLVRLAMMKSHFDFGWKYIRPKAQYIKMIAKLGLPSGATQAIFSSAMIVVQSLTNSFGANFVAANVIIMRVDGFAMMPNFSFGTALTTFAGQNVGAGKYDRVIKGAKQGTLMAVGISAGITVLILLFGKYLMGLFTETTELVNLSYRLMKILAVGYIAMAVTQSLSGIMRGAGDTLSPMIISIITTIAVRIPVAYGIAFFTSPDGVLNHGRSECIHISLLCSWVLGAILTVIFYRIGKWKKKSIA
jgi:putative MATE family efflux protein